MNEQFLIAMCVLGNCLLLILMWYVYAFLLTFNTAPFLPSRSKTIRDALQIAGINSQTNFIDVGSGDGRAVLIASRLGAASSTGVELNPFLSLLGKLVLKLNRTKNTRIINADMFKMEFSKYDMIYCYLLTDTMGKILDVIKRTAKPGTILVTNTFRFKELTPIKEVDNVRIYQL